MQIAIVANRATPTNVSLASHPWLGRRPLILSPREALQRLRPGDVALGRLDVRPSLAGIEPGMPQLRQLEERGVRVLNGAGTLTATHDKLVTARALAAPASRIRRRSTSRPPERRARCRSHRSC